MAWNLICGLSVCILSPLFRFLLNPGPASSLNSLRRFTLNQDLVAHRLPLYLLFLFGRLISLVASRLQALSKLLHLPLNRMRNGIVVLVVRKEDTEHVFWG